MTQSNYDALILYLIVELLVEEKNPQGHLGPPVSDIFLSSPWYTNIIFVLQHLQAPQGMDKTRGIFSSIRLLDFASYRENCIGII